MATNKEKNIVSNEKESKMGEIKRKLSEQVASYSSQIFVFLFVYIWGWLDFSFLWVVLYLIGHTLNVRRKQKRENERKIARRIVEEGEEIVLKVCFILISLSAYYMAIFSITLYSGLR